MAKRREIDYEKSVGGSVLRRLMAYMKPYWHWMTVAFILVLCITGFELYRPILVGNVIDEFIGSGNFKGVKKIALIYLLVLLGSFVCNFLQTWILQLMGQNIIYNIRQQVFEHVHKLSLRFFDVTPVGRIVTRITNDVEALNEMYANILVKLFKNTMKIIGLAIVMISINFKMSIYAFLLLPLIIGLTILFKSVSRATYRVTRTKITAINTFL